MQLPFLQSKHDMLVKTNFHIVVHLSTLINYRIVADIDERPDTERELHFSINTHKPLEFKLRAQLTRNCVFLIGHTRDGTANDCGSLTLKMEKNTIIKDVFFAWTKRASHPELINSDIQHSDGGTENTIRVQVVHTLWSPSQEAALPEVGSIQLEMHTAALIQLVALCN